MDGNLNLKDVNFDGIDGIASICCVLGLKFPDSATEFQKAALTLAHLLASCRDFILSGRDVPQRLIDVACELMFIVSTCSDNQR